MTGLLPRIEQNLRNRQLLKRNQAVLVAVSGGLDSMALLKVLHALSGPHRWKLTVAHFHHQLRGRSSDADEKLVRQTAAALKLPFITARAEVREFAEKSGLSIEMAARKLRHEFFVRAARERNISVVALAHHADDQVELFFLRALRGAGGEGLAGMKWRSPSPVNRKIVLIRPLLDTTKSELRGFTREHRIRFREDATNAQLDLPRNRVRHELLPLLRRHYQPALTRTILRLMEIVGAEAEVVGGLATRWLGGLKRDQRAPRPARRGEGGPRKAGPGEATDFKKLPVAIQRRVLQWQLLELGVPADFELVERIRRSPDIFVSVGPGFCVARDGAGRVNLRTQPTVGFKVNELTVNLADRAGEVDFNGVRFRWNFEGSSKAARLNQKAGCEFFDADKIGAQIVLRHWRAGDRFQPIGLKSAVKLQDLFTNRKIPRAQRRDLVVAEAGNGGIFWVEHLRMAEQFKLTPETKRRLVWRWRCGSD